MIPARTIVRTPVKRWPTVIPAQKSMKQMMRDAKAKVSKKNALIPGRVVKVGRNGFGAGQHKHAGKKA